MTTSTLLIRVRHAGVLRAAWAPFLVFGLHLFISKVLNAYLLYPPLDIPMHFFGGVAIAYFFAACLSALPSGAISSEHRPALHAVGVFALTCTASVFWEFAEFFSDLLLGTHAQLSLGDTLLDMALGTAGGLSFIVWALWSGALRAPRPLAAEPLAPSGPVA